MKFPLVGFKFYDHSMSDVNRLEPFVCSVIGWLYAEDKLYYHIATWVCNGQMLDSDTECFHILKSTIVEKYDLNPKLVKKLKHEVSRAKKS